MADVKKFVKSKKLQGKAEANVGPGSGLSGKIARHNMSKLNHFVKKQKMKKSIDFQQTKTSIDSKDQLLAETTTSPELLNYIKSAVDSELSKIPFAKGTLVLSQKEPGLFNGFFQDQAGQIVEKFDSQTVEIIAKNMEMKQLYDRPVVVLPVSVPEAPAPIKDMKSLRIKFGDFELELRKSVKDFINDFRQARIVEPSLIKKAIQSWRRKSKEYLDIPSDSAAARELFNNWEQHQEDFSQIVYALEQLEKDNE